MDVLALKNREKKLSKVNADIVIMLEKIVLSSDTPQYDDIQHAYNLSAKAGNCDVFKYLAENYKGALSNNIHYLSLLEISGNKENISKPENRLELAKYIIEDIDIVPTEDILINASKSGHTELVKYLLETTTLNINAKDSMPLLDACKENKTGTALELIFRGANVDGVGESTSNYGMPLKQACMSGNLTICKYLLKNGADINAGNSSSLYASTVFNHISVVEYLLNEGINPFAENNKALDYAKDKNLTEVSNMIMSAQKEEHGTRRKQVQNRHKKMVR